MLEINKYLSKWVYDLFKKQKISGSDITYKSIQRKVNSMLRSTSKQLNTELPNVLQQAVTKGLILRNDNGTYSFRKAKTRSRSYRGMYSAPRRPRNSAKHSPKESELRRESLGRQRSRSRSALQDSSNSARHSRNRLRVAAAPVTDELHSSRLLIRAHPPPVPDERAATALTDILMNPFAPIEFHTEPHQASQLDLDQL